MLRTSTGFLITISGGLALAIIACDDSTNPPLGNCGAPATRVHAIQGTGRSSPLLRPEPGKQEVVVEAVVVGLFPDRMRGLGGFFLQEEDDDADDDPRTSEGLFVFDSAIGSGIAVGDRVRVRGRVAEFFGLTELTQVSELIVCPPQGIASARKIGLPLGDAVDWERWEGMRVEFDQALVVTGHHNLDRFGEIQLAVGGRLEQPTQREAPGVPALELLARNARRRILLDDGSHASRPEPTPYLVRTDGRSLRLGDSLAHLEGVVGFAFGRFRIHPIAPVHFTAGDPRPSQPPEVNGTLRFVTWNVENYMNGDGRGGGFPTRGPRNAVEFDRQQAKLVETLVQLDPDIVALVEVENDGTGPESAIGQLVREWNARIPGAPFAVIHPDAARLGPQPIAVGIVYRRDTVAPIGPPAILDQQAHPEFDGRRNRPSLAQTFLAFTTGESLTIVVNHLKSKGSNCDAVGDPDLGDGQGECNVTRTRAARALLEWLGEDPTRSMGVPVLLAGDFNAYPREDPLRAVETADYVDLIARFADPAEYTFVFDGQAGRLDYALAAADLLPLVSGAGVWHTNSDEPPVFDYRLDRPTDRYEEDPFRASDHDPVLVGLFPDRDADGLTDSRDGCPDSERSATISIADCESGVSNRLGESGCTLSDELLALREFPVQQGLRVQSVDDWIELHIEDGTIEPHERDAILQCIAPGISF